MLLRSSGLVFQRQSGFAALCRRISTTKPIINYTQAKETPTDTSLEGRTLNNLNRPMSPHITIYEPQLTWLMSIGHRVTGAALSVGIYGFGVYYAVAAPEALTDQMSAWISNDCPSALVYAGKYVLAAPFIYHTLNGIRHLVWDMTWSFSLKNVYIGGWLVNIGTLIGAGFLTLL